MLFCAAACPDKLMVLVWKERWKCLLSNATHIKSMAYGLFANKGNWIVDPLVKIACLALYRWRMEWQGVTMKSYGSSTRCFEMAAKPWMWAWQCISMSQQITDFLFLAVSCMHYGHSKDLRFTLSFQFFRHGYPWLHSPNSQSLIIYFVCNTASLSWTQKGLSCCSN